MRIRRTNALLVGIIFVLAMFGMYLMLDRSINEKMYRVGPVDISDVEREVGLIEDEIRANHKTLKLIRQVLKDLGDTRGRRNPADVKSVRLLSEHLAEQSRLEALGRWRSGRLPHVSANVSCPALSQADLRMMDVYAELPFDNPDGGAWKQGYPITYDKRRWDHQKLQVFVIPHAHCDPGWRKTFENYFSSQTRPILNNMLQFLAKHPEMRFIYAEMSFFNLWWQELNESERATVRKFIQDGRLEIVTGGWVMNDEANTHYSAMIDQLFEGHQFMMKEVKVTPNASWSIDPFGHSPTMAFLLRKVGFASMLIQRVHYSIKKFLSKRQDLEFIWRQHWDKDGSSDIFCHMMPFYSYDVPHTCGPEPAICCQFDFARLPGSRYPCPWRIPPAPINDKNVAERAAVLLDQYRKKSTLYRNNVLLIPLGDDFRYDVMREWEQQYDNYKKLFDYMNAKKEWNVEVRFATLSDYFNALRKRTGLQAPHTGLPTDESMPRGFKTLVGDMFTYADRDDHYWSGYYTSRPFHKRMERVLETSLRSAEIAYSLALARAWHDGASASAKNLMVGMAAWLKSARRSLGLFQHHDGITGTGKAHVMADYKAKMLRGLAESRRILAQSAYFILSVNKDSEPFEMITEENQLVLSVLPQLDGPARVSATVLPLSKDTQRHVVLFNPLAHPRESLVTLRVSSPHVEVRSPGNQALRCQIDPVFSEEGRTSFQPDSWDLHFGFTAGPLALNRFSLKTVEAGSPTACTISSVVFFNSDKTSDSEVVPVSIEHRKAERFIIDNMHIRVHIGPNGLIQAIDSNAVPGGPLPLDVHFAVYGARTTTERSGAYLFLPDSKGIRQEMGPNNLVRIIRGPLRQESRLFAPEIEHAVVLVDTKGSSAAAVHVENVVDIRETTNYELAMRLVANTSWLDNRGTAEAPSEFYTDLNCYQMLRRAAWSKLPLQANVYPMPCAAMLEAKDRGRRLTVLSGQPLGAGSLAPGQLDIFLDRRLNQDDNRGLGESVQDNQVTRSTFRIIIEALDPSSAVPRKPDIGFLTGTSHLVLHDLLHPVQRLVVRADYEAPKRLQSSFNLLTGLGLPCDFHLVNLKALGVTGQLAMIVHRTQTDCRERKVFGAHCVFQLPSKALAFSSMFNDLVVSRAELTSLTMLKTYGRLTQNRLQVEPMGLETLLLTFK